MPFDENEISIKAHGGTELAKRMLANTLDKELLSHFQIIPSRIRDLQEDKIRILFLNDLAGDPEVAQLKDHNYRNKFHKFVFISNWQYQQFQTILNFPYDHKSIVIESGIAPSSAKFENKPTDKINLVYTSTPQRGLNILAAVFNELCKRYDNLHLDVFSSFKIYGWEEQDKAFETLYQQIRDNPNATYHGFVPHDELLKHVAEQSHIFAYPSIWQETSCRAMLEAMASQCVCVHPNFAGLPDTSGSLNLMYAGDQDVQVHANLFMSSVEQAIKMINDRENVDKLQQRLQYVQNYVNGRFNITNVSRTWDNLLRGLLQTMPDPKSRRFPGDMFSYKF